MPMLGVCSAVLPLHCGHDQHQTPSTGLRQHSSNNGESAGSTSVWRLYKVWWLCLPLSCGCTRYGGYVCLCRVVVQGMVAVFAFAMRLYKVWWLCLPLLCGCTRYGGCVCLCRVVVQGMVAVFAFAVRFAFVVWLYKVWWLCLPLSWGCTSTVAVFAFVMRLYKYGGCVCLCEHCALATRSIMFRSRSVQWVPVIARIA